MPHHLDITKRLHEQMLEIVGRALPLITSSTRDADLDGTAFVRRKWSKQSKSIIATSISRAILPKLKSRDLKFHRLAGLREGGGSALRAAYSAFRRRWSDRTVIDNWPKYRLSAVLKHSRTTVRAAEQVRIDHSLPTT